MPRTARTTSSPAPPSHSADRQFLYAGTVLGDMKLFNLSSGEETTYQCHESCINHIQPSNNTNLVITSASWRLPYNNIRTSRNHH